MDGTHRTKKRAAAILLGFFAAAAIAMPSAQAAEGYAHLFAAKAVEPVAKNKDQPLKSLLERIATCR